MSDENFPLPAEIDKKQEPQPETVLEKAQRLLQPTRQAGFTVMGFNENYLGVGALDFAEALDNMTRSMQDGDMSHTEAILFNQAVALDTVAGELMRRATEHVDKAGTFKAYLMLGLKAQSQCARTIEVLGNLKNPAPYIQNNRAQYQQVNNGQAYPEPRARVEKDVKSTSKIQSPSITDGRMEDETLDFGGAPESVGSNTPLETMGENDRPEN